MGQFIYRLVVQMGSRTHAEHLPNKTPENISFLLPTLYIQLLLLPLVCFCSSPVVCLLFGAPILPKSYIFFASRITQTIYHLLRLRFARHLLTTLMARNAVFVKTMAFEKSTLAKSMMLYHSEYGVLHIHTILMTPTYREAATEQKQGCRVQFTSEPRFLLHFVAAT